MNEKERAMAEQKSPLYRIETDGMVFTITRHSRRFLLFGPFVYRAVYESMGVTGISGQIVQFETSKEAQAVIDRWTASDIRRKRRRKHFRPINW
jgi:hypothetical protein